MTKVTKKVAEDFLAMIASGTPIMHACEQVGVARKTIYAHRSKNEKFAVAWDDAIEDSRLAKLAELEKEADRRAMEGVTVGVFVHTGQTFPKKRYSDSLLITRLKALDPDTYGERSKDEDDDDTGPALVPLISFVEPEAPKEEAPSDDG